MAIEHEVISTGEIHQPWNWRYADAAARTSAVITDANQVGKIALQESDNSIWILTGSSPATWAQLTYPQSDISITESQISDLQAYLTSETDPVFSASEAASFVAGDKSKLDAIEAGATADQVWGEIGGTLSNQTDLQNALNAKLDDTDVGVMVQAYDADIPTVAASQAEMEAGTETALRSMSPTNIKQAIDKFGDNEEWSALSGTTPNITAGSYTWTLTGNSTPTDGLADGDHCTLMIDDGTAYTINWGSVVDQWDGGSAPTLPTTGYIVVVLWKVGTTVYAGANSGMS